MNDDVRAELGTIAASLRAYLEWQRDTGAAGIPRARRGTPASVVTPASVAPAALATAELASAEPSRDPESAAAPEQHALASVAAAGPRLSRDERLPLLQSEVAGCTKCALSKTRTQTVFARGNPAAALCFVGEAPGADEDAQGLPFVGRAGQLLDKMIGAMGLSPARDVYVCNIIKCRPPENRRPESDEIATCIPYLHEQLALVKPKAIVAMGNTAVAALLGTKLGISKLRGEWKLYKGTTLVMPTYHPSYLLRPSPQQVEAKKHAWEDLQAVMKELKLPVPPRKS